MARTLPAYEKPDAETSRRMAAIGNRDTKPELLVRSLVHRMGLRFRVNAKPEPALRTRADILFRPAKVVVYIDGCFWHGCPDHGHTPSTNKEYWTQKIAVNRDRDQRTTKLLIAEGWCVLRFWEHEDPAEIATKIRDAVGRSQPTPTGSLRPR